MGDKYEIRDNESIYFSTFTVLVPIAIEEVRCFFNPFKCPSARRNKENYKIKIYQGLNENY